MGRHPVVPGEPATTQIKVRLSRRERRALAFIRGKTPESTYVRYLIRRDVGELINTINEGATE